MVLPQTPEETCYFPIEPAILDIIISNYTGESKDGCYHGHGEAQFKSGSRYTGDWSQGRMHGQGLFHWTDGISYEGTFVQNQIQGRGVYTWPAPDDTFASSYTGEVQDGFRHGQGTLTTLSSCGKHKFVYEGQWQRGFRHGHGRLHMLDNQDSVQGPDPSVESKHVTTLSYEGEWQDGEKHGMGIMTFPSGNKYEGEWKEGRKCGRGTMVWYDVNERYVGDWKEDVQDGQGEHCWEVSSNETHDLTSDDQEEGGVVMTIPSKPRLCNRYVGQFQQGLRSGKGTFYYANGSRYYGDWKDNLKEGTGVFIFEDGHIYDGVFSKDRMMMKQQQLKSRDTIEAKLVLYLSDVYSSSHEKPQNKGERERELDHALLRINTDLKAMYSWYSREPVSSSLQPQQKPTLDHHRGAVTTMTLSDFWRFSYDCALLSDGISITTINRMWYQMKSQHHRAIVRAHGHHHRDESEDSKAFQSALVTTLHGHHHTEDTKIRDDIHDGERVLLYREFVELFVRLAHARAVEQEDICTSKESLGDTVIKLYLKKLRPHRETLTTMAQVQQRSSSHVAQSVFQPEVRLICTKYQTLLSRVFDQHAHVRVLSFDLGYHERTISCRAIVQLLQQMHHHESTFELDPFLVLLGTKDSSSFQNDEAVDEKTTMMDSNQEDRLEIDPFVWDQAFTFFEFQQALVLAADLTYTQVLPIQIKMDQLCQALSLV